MFCAAAIIIPYLSPYIIILPRLKVTAPAVVKAMLVVAVDIPVLTNVLPADDAATVAAAAVVILTEPVPIPFAKSIHQPPYKLTVGPNPPAKSTIEPPLGVKYNGPPVSKTHPILLQTRYINLYVDKLKSGEVTVVPEVVAKSVISVKPPPAGKLVS